MKKPNSPLTEAQLVALVEKHEAVQLIVYTRSFPSDIYHLIKFRILRANGKSTWRWTDNRNAFNDPEEMQMLKTCRSCFADYDNTSLRTTIENMFFYDLTRNHFVREVWSLDGQTLLFPTIKLEASNK